MKRLDSIAVIRKRDRMAHTCDRDVFILQLLGHRIDLVLMLDVADQNLQVRKELGNFLLTLFGSDDQDDLGTDLEKGLGNVGRDALFVGHAKDNHSLLCEAEKV